MRVMSPRQFNLLQKNKKDNAKKKRLENLKKARAAKEQKQVPIEDLIEMRCYIKYNLYYGQPKEKIIQALIEQGWKKDEIEVEVSKMNAPKDYTIKNKIPLQPKANPIPAEKEEDIIVPLPPQARN